MMKEETSDPKHMPLRHVTAINYNLLLRVGQTARTPFATLVGVVSKWGKFRIHYLSWHCEAGLNCLRMCKGETSDSQGLRDSSSFFSLKDGDNAGVK